MNYKVPVLLLPNGQLAIELPASNGATRTVALKRGDESSMLRMVLSAGSGLIDSDGAPTRSRAKHLQYHMSSPDPSCPFCKDEGRVAKEVLLRWRSAGNGVQVRRIKPKGRKDDLMEVDLDF